MTSRDTIKTPQEYKQDFDSNLKGAIEIGSYPCSAAGFDPETFELLTQLAKKYPETDADLVKKARESFAFYLDWLTSD